MTERQDRPPSWGQVFLVLVSRLVTDPVCTRFGSSFFGCFFFVWFFWKYCGGQTISQNSLNFSHPSLTSHTGFTGSVRRRKCLEPAGSLEVNSCFTWLTFCEFYTDSVPSAPRSCILILILTVSLYIHADVDL